jgi:hydroxymethylglutaryl-CoA lyase
LKIFKVGKDEKKSQVLIREVSLRDGLQSVKQFVPTLEKAKIAAALYEAGIRILETTSFVSPIAIPQLRDASKLLKIVDEPGIIHEVMVPNLKGAELAIKSNVNKLIVFISATDTHNRANVNRSVKESLDELQSIFELAQKNNIPICGAIAVAFGCPFQGKVSKRDVLLIARHFIDQGCERITLADTTGMANPIQISETLRFFSQEIPGVDICLHLHNNRGTAMANLYEAFRSGARIFDTALGGIGGCPNVPLAAGNLATEDVVFILHEMGVDTGIDIEGIIKAAELLERTLGYTLPGQVMKSGPNTPPMCQDSFHL